MRSGADTANRAMRLISRNDVFLLGGLGVALFVLFSGPLGHILDLAHQMDQSHGVRLLPALVILAAVFVFHQQRKRHEAWAEAAAAATDARHADARVTEMERLVAFGQTLARALDFESIRDAAAEHLPTLVDRAGRRGPWSARRSARRCNRSPPRPSRPTTSAFPMIVGGEPIGVLGVAPEPALTEDQRSVLTAAAAHAGRLAQERGALSRGARQQRARLADRLLSTASTRSK